MSITKFDSFVSCHYGCTPCPKSCGVCGKCYHTTRESVVSWDKARKVDDRKSENVR